MEESLENKDTGSEEIFSDGISEGIAGDISIQEFIKRKRLQNRILGEIIEKIRNEEIGNKPQDQQDTKPSKG